MHFRTEKDSLACVVHSTQCSENCMHLATAKVNGTVEQKVTQGMKCSFSADGLLSAKYFLLSEIMSIASLQYKYLYSEFFTQIEFKAHHIIMTKACTCIKNR